MFRKLEKRKMLSLMLTALLFAGATITGLGQPKLFDERIKSLKHQGLTSITGNYNAGANWYEVSQLWTSPAENESASAYSLAQIINRYRRQQGLDEIPISPSLTYVAKYHVYDLEKNNPDTGSCNLHSWSNKGDWTPCCYTSNHARARCMWDKPKELTSYKGNGYEIAAMSTGGITAQEALELWQESSPHHNVILNRGIWADQKFKAMGAAVSNYYAVVWFGTETDPAD